MVLSAFLIDLKCRLLQSGLSDVENTKYMLLLLMVKFFHNSKIHIFWRFLKDL